MSALEFGQYAPDTLDLEGVTSQTISGVVPLARGYGPFASFQAFTQTVPGGVCRGYFFARNTDGSVTIFAASPTKLYKLNNTTFAWIDVSKGLAAYAAVNSNDQWQFAQFLNTVIAVQANIPPQAFNLNGGVTFLDLGGTPPQAAYVTIVGRFVVLSGLLNNAFRVQWSGLNQITIWDNLTAQSNFQDLPDGGIVRGVAGGEYGIIMQDASIRRMTYAPGSPVIFQIERIAENDGIYAPLSLIRAGDRVFFISPQGFKKIVSGGYPEQIGKERVDATFFKTVDSASPQLILGATDPRTTRVYWAFKSKQGISGQFDLVLLYDWVLDRFAILPLIGHYITSLAQPGITLEGLDAIAPGGSVDAMTQSLDSFPAAAQSALSAAGVTGMIGFFTGPSIEAILDTPEEGFPGDLAEGERILVSGVRPLTDCPNAQGSLFYRDDLQSSSAQTPEVALNLKKWFPFNKSTRYARARLRNPAASTWTFAAAVEPMVAPDGDN